MDNGLASTPSHMTFWPHHNVVSHDFFYDSFFRLSFTAQQSFLRWKFPSMHHSVAIFKKVQTSDNNTGISYLLLINKLKTKNIETSLRIKQNFTHWIALCVWHSNMNIEKYRIESILSWYVHVHCTKRNTLNKIWYVENVPKINITKKNAFLGFFYAYRKHKRKLHTNK